MAGKKKGRTSILLFQVIVYFVYICSGFCVGVQIASSEKNVTLYFSFAIVNKPQNNTKKSVCILQHAVHSSHSERHQQQKKRKVSFDTKKKKIISESENLLHQNTSG